MENINHLFADKQWEEIAHSYNPEEVISKLAFNNALTVAYKLLYNDKWDESLQIYSVNLLTILRTKYPSDWNSSWRNDAFLGLACNIIFDYDGRYQAYLNAYKKANPPPPELLIELARCCICPGKPPISYDEAIALLERSIEEHQYIDAIGLLKTLYGYKNNKEKESYWNEMLKKIGEKGERSPPLEPSFLREA